MPRLSSMIDDRTYENACAQLKQYGNTAKISIKLRAIIAAKKHGISNVAEIFDITRKSLMKWIKDFKSNGPDQLKVQVGRGRKPRVNIEQMEEIKSWVLLNPNITTRELALRINKTMKLSLSMSTAARPVHNKQNKELHVKFKHEVKEYILDNPKVKVLFFDESRFGTHSKIGHGWFIKGTRTQVKIKLGFENFYIYSAVSSIDGFNFSLLMPSVDTDCMNAYLSELSKSLDHEQIVLILDGAGWHRSDALCIPNNIKLIQLPAYSPELNPVERLWAYMKHHLIRNKIYASINDLYDAVCSFMQDLDDELVKSVCHCNYMDI